MAELAPGDVFAHKIVVAVSALLRRATRYQLCHLAPSVALQLRVETVNDDFEHFVFVGGPGDAAVERCRLWKDAQRLESNLLQILTQLRLRIFHLCHLKAILPGVISTDRMIRVMFPEVVAPAVYG